MLLTLKKFQRALSDGPPAPDMKMTVHQLLFGAATSADAQRLWVVIARKETLREPNTLALEASAASNEYGIHL
jgi:hypothetical protein